MSGDDPIRSRAEAKAKQQQAWMVENDPDKMSPTAIRAALAELHVHQIELEMQNEELRRTQAELEERRAAYYDLYDLAPVGYCTISEKGQITKTNLLAATLLGMSRNMLCNQFFSRLVADDDVPLWLLARKRLFESGEPQSLDLRMIKENCAPFWVHLEAAIDQSQGREPKCRITFSDITERRRGEVALEQAHQENKDLLVELQHRVKNSFSSISSLIGMTQTDLVSPVARQCLMDLDDRIRSMAALYSLLNSSSTLTEVRLDEYCSLVATPLVAMAHLPLDQALEGITVPGRVAAPVGMILTELVTNAIKHAFPQGKTGLIRIALRKTEKGVLLEVRDNGKGMPADFVQGANAGLGLKLVLGFVGQIGGTLEVESSAAGTRSIVEFPVEEMPTQTGPGHDRP